jgi:hypothetical protein
VAKAVSIAAVSRLLPLAALGFGINMVTGAMFLMTESDQYKCNPSFHFKGTPTKNRHERSVDEEQPDERGARV